MWYHVKCLGHDTSVRQHYKMSIELPVTTKHCRDMTEKLLKAMLNRNKQQIHITHNFLTLDFSDDII